jgi:hypothetical protein
VSKYLQQKSPRMPRTGYWNGTITLVMSDWYANLPAKMRREFLKTVGDTADDMHNVTWVMRVASERHWPRNVS